MRSSRLKVGQRLTIHPRRVSTKSSKKPTKTVVNTAGRKTYTVGSGDSLWSISQKFPGVSVDEIKKWNGISSSKLKIGAKLIVSKG
jgi:membrane-bound lytic murein transglycosylase D